MVAQVQVGGTDPGVCVGVAELHQRHLPHLYFSRGAGLAITIEVFELLHAHAQARLFFRNMVLVHLAFGIDDQCPAILDIGHAAPRHKHRVGRVQPPDLTVDLSLDDGVIGCACARQQQTKRVAATADPGGLRVYVAGLQHRSQQYGQVFAIAVTALFDLAQGKGYIATICGAPVTHITVLLVDVLHHA